MSTSPSSSSSPSEPFNIRKLYNPTVFIALALMVVILMMILPVPSWVLDTGLAISFAIAILIFTITLFIDRPLDFSAFPTILLASLMLRLSLNVSSTKLIIGEGHTGTDAAGGIISGFASFIMQDNIFLGIVVFLVLMIVNFIVITKGAGRMAEVGARFSLDAMPGKQLAIDSDLAAGAITHEDAKIRRKVEQEETTFFGSLDGASKFVKGDAVAGLLITMLNILVGLGMGMGYHDMAFGDAIQTYAVLTVGDGLVSQIPSVIISIAAALLLSKGGQAGSADRALITQLGAYPWALATVSGLLLVFAVLPGLPFLPFMGGATVLAIMAWTAYKKTCEKDAEQAREEALALPPPEETSGKKSIADLMDVDEIHVEFSPELVPIAMEAGVGLEGRIENMRRHIVAEYGFVMPEVRLTDNPMMKENNYAIKIQGVQVARDLLRPGRILTLTRDDVAFNVYGEDVKEPVYGAPARWIEERDREEASSLGLPVVEPAEVLATHLLETVQNNFGRLLTRRSLRRMLEEFQNVSDEKRATMNKQIIDEFIPDKVSMDLLQSVLRLLLEERVPVRNIPIILEAITEAKTVATGTEQIAEYVRQRISFILVARLLDGEGHLPLIQLGPQWEKLFDTYQTGEDANADVALPPQEFNRLAAAVRTQLNTASVAGAYPAIITSTKRRRFLREVFMAKGIRNPVLSFEEVGSQVTPSIVGVA